MVAVQNEALRVGCSRSGLHLLAVTPPVDTCLEFVSEMHLHSSFSLSSVVTRWIARRVERATRLDVTTTDRRTGSLHRSGGHSWPPTGWSWRSRSRLHRAAVRPPRIWAGCWAPIWFWS